MRRKLIIAACGLVAVLAALPFLIDANRYREPIRSQLEARLKRPVSIGNLTLHLVPPTIDARDIKIGDDAAITASPFLTVESATVKPDWSTLLFHWNFEARSLILNRPTIELIRKMDGGWNVSTLIPTGPQTASPPLANLEIRDGTLAYTDLAAGKPRATYGLILEATKTSSTYQVHAAIPSGLEGRLDGSAVVAINTDKISAKGDLTIANTSSLAFDVAFDRATSMLHLTSLEAKTKANSIGATGDIDLHSSPMILHLRADHLKGPIDGLGPLAALFGFAIPPSLALAGTLDGNLTIEGPATQPALNGHLEIASFVASSKTWKDPVKSPLVRLDFDPTSLRAAPMTLACGATQLTASGTITDYTKDQPHVDAQIKSSQASLDELLNIAAALGLSATAGVSGHGSASIDVHALGPVKNPNLTGQVSIDNATVSLASLAKPVAVAHLNMKFTGNTASIDNLTMTAAGANLTGSLILKNFAAPQVTFMLNADKLDLAQLPESKKQGASPLEKVTAKGSLTAGQIVSNGVILTRVKSTLSLDHGIARLAPLNAGMFDGTVTGSIEADLRKPVPTFHTNLVMNQVDANALLSATTPVKQRLFGKLASDSTLSFTGTQDSLAQTLTGTLNLKLTDGRLTGLNMLNEVAKAGRFLGFKGNDNDYTAITALNANLTIENGRAQATGLRFETDGATVTGAGTINLVDQGLDLRLVATLSKELLDRAGGNAVGGLMVTALSSPDGSVVVPVRVHGTFAQPQVAPDAERFAEMKIKMLEHPIDTVLGIFDTLTKPKPKQ